MTERPSILFLILARGGSKGVPNKNLQRLHGLSLVGFKARAASAVMEKGDRLILSTDSPLIQDEGRLLGVEVPFTRPDELATDTATSESAVAHALAWLQAHDKVYDTVMLLEPSTPFATPTHMRQAIAAYSEKGADLITGMRETEPARAFIGLQNDDGCIADIIFNIQDMRKRRRQDQRGEWTINGGMYLFSWKRFSESRQIYATPDRSFGILMDRWHSIEIEAMDDLVLADFALAKAFVDRAVWGA